MPLFTILTLFPEALEPYLKVGVLGGALEQGLLQAHLVDFRDWARDRHRTVDDRPFGGGPGMVLKPEPVAECLEWVEARDGRHRRLVLDPAGRPFDQPLAEELSREPRVALLCGRYEGFDARLYEAYDLEPVSVGDFVLAGGELPALCVLEAAARLVPGVLGDERSAAEDSFQDGDRLDHPHFTRPRTWRGREVPEVLFSGDHARIARWRAEQAEARTRARRRATAGQEGQEPGPEPPPPTTVRPVPHAHPAERGEHHHRPDPQRTRRSTALLRWTSSTSSNANSASPSTRSPTCSPARTCRSTT